MNTFAVPKEMKKQMETISREMRINKQEIFNRAMLLYFESMRKQLDFFRELKAWDQLSNESLLKYL